MFDFEYILGGDLTLIIIAKVTEGFAGDRVDPPCEPEMEIQSVTYLKYSSNGLPTTVDFETDDIYIKRHGNYHELDSLIIEEGWDHISKMERDE